MDIGSEQVGEGSGGTPSVIVIKSVSREPDFNVLQLTPIFWGFSHKVSTPEPEVEKIPGGTPASSSDELIQGV